MKRSVLWTLIKWTITITILLYLWKMGFFFIIFVYIPHLIVYVYGLFIDYGIIPVLRFYKYQWYLAMILGFIASILFFQLLWRAKRKDFKIGGEFEGRVIWARGLRQGWIYGCWDLYNYLMHRFGKKKERVSITQDLSRCTEISPGTWPDPFSIPLGLRSKTHYILYIRRRLFQIIPERWIIPRNIVIRDTPYTITIPNLDVQRIPRPDIPGRFDYHLTSQRMRSYEIDGASITQKNRKMLKRSNQYVEIAILSDSETQKVDFVKGSRLNPFIRDREGEYD